MHAWYLLYCKRGQIIRAQQHLEQQSIESFTPLYKTEKIVRNKRTWVDEPLFPNYLFINFDPETTHTTTIAATRGVSNFVRIGKLPVIVPEELITDLKALSIDTISNINIPQSGDAVVLNEGIFKGLEAIYSEPDGETRSFLLIKLLGQTVKKSVSNSEFKKLDL